MYPEPLGYRVVIDDRQLRGYFGFLGAPGLDAGTHEPAEVIGDHSGELVGALDLGPVAACAEHMQIGVGQ